MNICEVVDLLNIKAKKYKYIKIYFQKRGSKLRNVLISTHPGLKVHKRVDKKTFKKFITNCKDLAISFMSLSRRNKLVIPCKPARDIGDFTRKYPKTEQLKFWEKVLKCAPKNATIYTDGLDVAYLHIKIAR